MAGVVGQINRWTPRPMSVLGTDGFGRSDTREALRSFFEVDAAHVVVTVLNSLARDGEISREVVADANGNPKIVSRGVVFRDHKDSYYKKCKMKR